MFCKYKNIFGEPNKGIHSIRFFGFGAIDLITVLFSAWLIAYWVGGYMELIFLGLIILGIIVHKLFCVETTLNRMIFTLFKT